jgi:hypothetical protein
MFDLIIGAIIAVAVGIYNKVCLPPKDDMEKNFRASLIIIAAFVITIIIVMGYYIVIEKNIVSFDFIEQVSIKMSVAVGLYEIVYKQAIKPILIGLGLVDDK